MPTFRADHVMPSLLLSSSLSIVILALMLFMAFRLNSSNRRSAYRHLVISLGFILTHHMMQLALSLGWLPQAAWLTFAGKVLQVFSFIVMNFAIFELYYKRRPRTRMWLYGLLALGAFIACCDLLPGLASDAGWSLQMRPTPLLDGYWLALILLFALMFGPHIGQRGKYGVGLAAAFVAQICVLAAQYEVKAASVYIVTAELLHVINYILLFMLLFDRVVELLNAAYRSSITDGLTLLYNRRYFSGRLERVLQSGEPVGVIFFDIDNFKRLNDTHGHDRADGVLKQVSALIAEEVEGIGLAGRYGGEELVAFVVGPKELTLKTAETIRKRTEKESIVTVSVGVCHVHAGAGTSVEALLKHADQAMYYSKTHGKNRVTDYGKMPREDTPAAGMKR